MGADVFYFTLIAIFMTAGAGPSDAGAWRSLQLMVVIVIKAMTTKNHEALR